MGGIGKNMQEEFKKSTISVGQRFEARVQEKAKDRAIPLKLMSKPNYLQV